MILVCDAGTTIPDLEGYLKAHPIPDASEEHHD